MARSAATIQSEIDALRASLSKGILRVRHGDTETTYQSVDQMRGWLRELEGELNGVSDEPVRQVRFKTSKGFEL